MGEKGNAARVGAPGQHAASSLDGPAAQKPGTAAIAGPQAQRANSLLDPPQGARKAPAGDALPTASVPSSPPSVTLPPIVAVGSDDNPNEPEQ